VLTGHTLRGTTFLQNIVLDDWVRFFQFELPKTEGPLMSKAEDICRQYLGEVRSHIQGTAPDIIPYFDGTAGTMSGIKTELCDKIKASIGRISVGASQIHPLFVNSLRATLHPVFEEALEIRGKFAGHRHNLLSPRQYQCLTHLFQAMATSRNARSSCGKTSERNAEN
jgi:hypothetical protein